MALKLDTPAELQAYRLALQVKQLKERFKEGDDQVLGELVPVLSAWLKDHILQQDMALAEHVRATPLA